MLNRNHFKEIVFLVVATTAISLFLLVQANKLGKKRTYTTVVPAQTVTEVSPITETDTMDSPDGTMKLTMKTVEKDEEADYQVFVNTGTESVTEKDVATFKLSESKKAVIPYNTWSPDNKYFFLKETGPDGADYVIYPVSENNPPIRILPLFNEKLPGFAITDVTGWASPTLLIVNTVTEGGEKVSYWFDVTTQSFIRLDLYFN